MRSFAADPFGVKATVDIAGRESRIASLRSLEVAGLADLDQMPYCLRVLLENVLRNCGGHFVSEEDVLAVAGWDPLTWTPRGIPFLPSRVLLQDFTGVPAIVDLAALRDSVVRQGKDGRSVNPLVRTDLVVDHSVQVDHFGTADAQLRNAELEMRRNVERYTLLRWAQQAFDNLTVIPPGVGIVHQVNLEHLACVVQREEAGDGSWCYPDTVVGTDSHTAMINGLGVLGWGVGGIEAEAVMLGQPYFMILPEVYGVRLTGSLPVGSTATDLALVVTNLLRQVGVVGAFVEFIGPGAERLSLPERATVANMAPEYGATCGYFPVDDETIRYLRLTGRSDEVVARVDGYARIQKLFRERGKPEPRYSRVIELDIREVRPSLAGPRRPQDLVPLASVKESFEWSLHALAKACGRADATVCSAEVCLVGVYDEALSRLEAEGGRPGVNGVEGASEGHASVPVGEQQWINLRDGAVVIASITSCTNTSNPAVMIGAGLLARNAVKRGLSVPPWVKTSMAPGSRVVADYLAAAGLLPYLERLKFHVVGYGCATCIGNSGPLAEPLTSAIQEDRLVVASILSGNRNFEGRIHPLVRANYLASPILVVAYALAGTVDIDLLNEPLGLNPDGDPVYLAELWPAEEEIRALVDVTVGAQMCRHVYESVLEGEESWRRLRVPRGDLFNWQNSSSYVQEPPFFKDIDPEIPPLSPIVGARILGIFGDSVTTDHISPAGAIPASSPAGQYLLEHGVSPAGFNTYGSRRGNHEVMLRGAFASTRIRNLMVDREGGWTVHYPSGELMPIYEAAMRYKSENVPLTVLAGRDYGTGSSRDWAAKGPLLLGVRVVVAESYERIHRSNLVGMGILPLQLEAGAHVHSLGLTGREILDFHGVDETLEPGGRVWVRVRAQGDRPEFEFPVVVRLDSPTDLEYYRHGGIGPRVFRLLVGEAAASS